MIGRSDRAQDEEFAELLEAAWPRVFAYVRVLERDPADAEDVMAETVERALRAWHAGKRPRGDSLPWLLLIARRLVIDRSRRRRLLHSLLGRVRASQPHDGDMRRSEERMWFEGLAAVLPHRQFEAIVLRYVFDLPDSEMGQVLGLSPSGVRTLVSRAIVGLRSHPEVLG